MRSPEERERLHNMEDGHGACSCQVTSCEDCPECSPSEQIPYLDPLDRPMNPVVDKRVGDLHPYTQLTKEQEHELRAMAFRAVAGGHQRMQDAEYGSHHETTGDEVPLSVDLVEFVIWLRKWTDFFSGPETTINFPRHDSPEFLEVLGDLVNIWTGE